MYIWDQYQKVCNKSFTDEEFLAYQIIRVKDVFLNEGFAIKDKNLNYVAISDEYMQTFDLNDRVQLNEDMISLNHGSLFTPQIKLQEQQILEHRQYQDSIFILKKSAGKKLSHYVFRKRPLINPSTQNVVGLFVAFAKYRSGIVRESFVKRVLGWSYTHNAVILQPTELTDQQQQVLFCLSVGYHSRKEISDVLSQASDKNISERQIKYALKVLYDKFECSSPDQLLKSFAKNQLKIQMPLENIIEGEYLIK